MTLELITRLEKATGPDRGLDCRIAHAVKPIQFDDTYGPETWDDQQWRMAAGIYQIPLYTKSIDAALTLVPDGWTWECTEFDKAKYRATLSFKGNGAAPERTVDSCDVDGKDAPTPAIALCIAALKARLPPPHLLSKYSKSAPLKQALQRTSTGRR